jgi:hypothetical protein
MHPTLETALVVGFSQITEGEATCDICGEPAQVTLECEPDYDGTPMCWMHARGFVCTALYASDRLWP